MYSEKHQTSILVLIIIKLIINLISWYYYTCST